jgi:hypothetical protein
MLVRCLDCGERLFGSQDFKGQYVVLPHRNGAHSAHDIVRGHSWECAPVPYGSLYS